MAGGSWFSRFLSRGTGDASGYEFDCTEVRERGSDMLEDDCPEPIGERLRMHLGLCKDCDGWVKSLAITVGLLREMPRQEAPPSTVEKVRKIARGGPSA